MRDFTDLVTGRAKFVNGTDDRLGLTVPADLIADTSQRGATRGRKCSVRIVESSADAEHRA